MKPEEVNSCKPNDNIVETRRRCQWYCRRGTSFEDWLPELWPQKSTRAVERPQNDLSTKAVRECIVHALHCITEIHREAAVTSIDGVSAYDLISSHAAGIDESRWRALRFVRMFHGGPSEYLWEDEVSAVHRIPQGERGAQGDAMKGHPDFV